MNSRYNFFGYPPLWEYENHFPFPGTYEVLQAEDCLLNSEPPKMRILVASATANTGGNAVRQLAKMGHDVLALLKDKDDPRAKSLALMDNVTLVEGNFDDVASIKSHLVGVDRAILVSPPFAYEQFERETNFIKLCDEAGVDAVVRISFCLVLPGTKCPYGRAHHGIEAFCRGENPQKKAYPVVHLNPNWFFTNLDIFFGWDAKKTKKFSLPYGCGKKFSAIHPKDVGECAAAVATCAPHMLQKFLYQGNIEVHGPYPVSFEGMMRALSKQVGYEITIKEMKSEEWAEKMTKAFGMNPIYMARLAETIQMLNGSIDVWPIYPTQSSPILREIGWFPKMSVEDWASDTKTINAIKID